MFKHNNFLSSLSKRENKVSFLCNECNVNFIFPISNYWSSVTSFNESSINIQIYLWVTEKIIRENLYIDIFYRAVHLLIYLWVMYLWIWWLSLILYKQYSLMYHGKYQYFKFWVKWGQIYFTEMFIYLLL